MKITKEFLRENGFKLIKTEDKSGWYEKKYWIDKGQKMSISIIVETDLSTLWTYYELGTHACDKWHKYTLSNLKKLLNKYNRKDK